MLRKLLSWMVALAAMMALSIGATAVTGSQVALAQVTNCSTIVTVTGSSWGGGCQATTANSPYTTQFAVQGKCKYGTSTVWATSGWKNAVPGAYGIAKCPSGWKVDVSGSIWSYYLYR